MPKYRVWYSTTASTSVEVEADSPDDAREVANEAFESPMICAQCSGWGQEHDLELGDDWEQDDSEHGVTEA
jgi:hypothetical protein